MVDSQELDRAGPGRIGVDVGVVTPNLGSRLLEDLKYIQALEQVEKDFKAEVDFTLIAIENSDNGVDGGRFQLIRSDDVAASNMMDFGVSTTSRPVAFDIASVDEETPNLESLIVYNQRPLWTAFRVSDEYPGAVEMIRDQQLNDKPLAIPREIFAGPLRLWQPAEIKFTE